MTIISAAAAVIKQIVEIVTGDRCVLVTHSPCVHDNKIIFSLKQTV